MFELEGKQGYMAQRRGAAIQIIKCTSADATYRHIEEDTEEIPVVYKGRNMFVDPVSYILKPNATRIKAGIYMPIRWKIGEVWYCKQGIRKICDEPEKYQPLSTRNGQYMLKFEDLPLAGGMLTPEEIKDHETTIFYEETKSKAMDEMADDLINLRPTKISRDFSSNMVDYLIGLLYEVLSSGHTQAALSMVLVYILDHLVGFIGRILHISKNYQSYWNFLLIPFHQVFTLTVLKRLLRKKENPILTKDVQDDLDKCVKIDIET